jgi:hypothetical protein
VAVVLVDGEGEAEADWHSLVRPWRPVGAGQVHGLGAGSSSRRRRSPSLADRVDGLFDGRVLVGHNPGGDAAMPAQKWRRLGQVRGWATTCTREAAGALTLPGRRLLS